jgi:hypothetical protein
MSSLEVAIVVKWGFRVTLSRRWWPHASVNVPSQTGNLEVVAEGHLTRRRVISRSRDVTRERPGDKRMGVTVTHLILGFEVADDCHVLVEATSGDDPSPFCNRPTVLLLD